MSKRTKSLALLAAGTVAVAGGAIACGDDDGGGAGGDVGELKVGLLVPLSGDFGPFGVAGAQAAELAAAQVNAAAIEAGIDLTVNVSQHDTSTEIQAAQQAATRLIENDGVDALVGPWTSGNTISTAENVSIPAGIPLVSPAAPSPAITDLDDNDTVFRTVPSDALQGRVAARAMLETLGIDANVVTVNRNDVYGNALVEQFTQAWEDFGATVERNVSYNPEAADLDREAGQVVEGAPDAWFIIDFPDSWAKMGPALVRTGAWDPAETFTADGLRSSDLPEDAGADATEGMRGIAPTHAETPAGVAFSALWNAGADSERQIFDSNNFDAVMLIALAAARAGSRAPADIAANIQAVSGAPGEKYTHERLPEALAALKDGNDIDYEGVSGPLDLDDAGDPGSDGTNYRTWSYKGGELVDDDEVINFGEFVGG